MIIEGTRHTAIEPEEIEKYLNGLSSQLDMVTLQPAITHHSERYGWAAWIHWETSGAHFYAWDEPTPFFSVDIYTCKIFDPEKAIEHTRELLKPVELEHSEIFG